MESEDKKSGLLTKRNIIIGVIGLILIIGAFSTCGGNDKKAEDTTEHSNESREMPASAIELKGVHAGLFKVEGNIKLSLVKLTDKGGWEVRAKIPFIKIQDFDASQFKGEIACCPDMAYLDENEVEVQQDQCSDKDDFNSLLAKNVGDSESLTFRPYQYNGMSYDKAKKIYDATQGIVIKDIKLEELTKEEKKQLDSVFDDDDLKDVKDAAETAGKIIDAEMEMLKALGGLAK